MRKRVIKFDNAKIGVYRIVAPSGKIYIGMTCESFENRWGGHLKEIRLNKHPCIHLMRSVNKHGLENFVFEIVEEWTKPNNQKDFDDLEILILKRENYWWNYYKDLGFILYNGEPTGTGSVRHTKETRLRISQGMKNSEKIIKTISEKNLILFENFDKLKKLAENKDFTTTDIAKHFGVTPERIKNFCIQFEIELSNNKLHLEIYPILEWYFEEKLSTREIAKKIGVSQPTVLHYMKKFKETDSRFSLIKERVSLETKPHSKESIEKAKKTYIENNIKIKCENCEREISKFVFRKHSEACLKRIRCACGKFLSKQSAKQCINCYKVGIAHSSILV